MSSLQYGDYSHTDDHARMALGFVLLLLAVTMASAGGIGGGGIIGGILLVIFEFPFSTAVILALSAVTGSTFMQVFINFKKRHPFDESRPLIYWAAMLIMLPAQMGGANFGVLVDKSFPPSVLVAMAVVVLVLAGAKLLVKGSSLWKKETLYLEELRLEAEATAADGKGNGNGPSVVVDNSAAQSSRLLRRINAHHLLEGQRQHVEPWQLQQGEQHSGQARTMSEDRGTLSSPKGAAAAVAAAEASALSFHRDSSSISGSIITSPRDRCSSVGDIADVAGLRMSSMHQQRNQQRNRQHQKVPPATSQNGDVMKKKGRRRRTGPPEIVRRADGTYFLQLYGSPRGRDATLSPSQSQSQSQSPQQDEERDNGSQSSGSEDNTSDGSSDDEEKRKRGTDTETETDDDEDEETARSRLRSRAMSAADTRTVLDELADLEAFHIEVFLTLGMRVRGERKGRRQKAKNMRKKEGEDDVANPIATAAASSVQGASSGGGDSSRPPIAYPMHLMRAVAGIWAVYAIFILLSKTDSISPPCSSAFFAIYISSYVPLLLTIAWAVRHVARQQREQPHTLLLGDLQLTRTSSPSPATAVVTGKEEEEMQKDEHKKKENGLCCCSFRSISAPAASFVIGILCSLLGIGGGELMGPLMLSMGFLPQVTSATTSAMSFLNAALNIVHYWMNSELEPVWCLIMVGIGMSGGAAGRQLSMWISTTYGRPSATVFMLALILFFSVGLMVDQLADPGQTDFSGWKPICSPSVVSAR